MPVKIIYIAKKFLILNCFLWIFSKIIPLINDGIKKHRICIIPYYPPLRHSTVFLVSN